MDLRLMEIFKEISRIPRGSGNEKQISDYLVDFAGQRGLFCRQDEYLNVIIEKPAGKGYEAAAGIFLQAHIDMVCVKNLTSSHDFLTDGIEIVETDGVISARDTSLGADNGIGVAMILHLLDDCQNHPAIVAVFTVDEERGLLGVRNIDLTPYADIRQLVNLDGEEEGVFLTSCAGGMRYCLELPVCRERYADTGMTQVEILVSGLNGGHSGINIHKNYANAIVLMARILDTIMFCHEAVLLDVSGGGKENSIPADAKAVIAVSGQERLAVCDQIEELADTIRKEYSDTEPQMKISTQENKQIYTTCIPENITQSLTDMLLLLPNGLFKGDRSGTMAVSSSNIGTVTLMEEHVAVYGLIRSNINSCKYYTEDLIKKTGALFNAVFCCNSDYPAWEYRERSDIRTHFKNVYNEMFDSKPTFQSIHGGLECAYFAEKIPDIDMISIGCDIRDVHSVDEKLDMYSATRVYRFLKEALRLIVIIDNG